METGQAETTSKNVNVPFVVCKIFGDVYECGVSFLCSRRFCLDGDDESIVHPPPKKKLIVGTSCCLRVVRGCALRVSGQCYGGRKSLSCHTSIII